MENLIFLVLCICLGAILKNTGVLKNEAHLTLNNILLYICLPAATLLHTTETQFSQEYLLPILMPWVSFIGAIVFFQILDKFLHFHKHTKAVLILTAGIPSISFVGFPIFEMLYGKQGLEIGIMMSQSGSFLVCSTLGVMLASYYAHEKANFGNILLNVFQFPTFIAFCVAIVLNFSDFHFSKSISIILEKISAPFSFLALISIGSQLPFRKTDWQVTNLRWGLFYKLIVIPIVIFVIYGVGLQKREIMLETSVLGAAIGPMNTIAIISMNYKLNPPLASQMIALGIPVSLITVSIFHFIIQYIF